MKWKMTRIQIEYTFSRSVLLLQHRIRETTNDNSVGYLDGNKVKVLLIPDDFGYGKPDVALRQHIIET